jgi:hypothetical protein
MDDETRKLIQSCSIVSANPSTAMRLDHLVTGEKYFDKQMYVVCGDDIITHPDKTTVSNLLEILNYMPNHSYLVLVHDPKLELLRVKKSRVCNKKICKETKKGDQNWTLLKILKGKKKPSTKHVPCNANVTDEDLLKSATTLDDSEEILLFVAWGSEEYLRHITIFLVVLSIDTTYGTNRERRLLVVLADTDHNRKNFTAMRAFIPSECEWVFRYVFEVAIHTLIGTATVDRICQINTAGGRPIYNPLTKCV